ncbi:hypothetical protein ABZW30_44280 [Kitasatospora sp. NPDC004669]|uniref:hypothetical protein n=1 Tax=Kitasatospora sp. NPDC004669 TaxID=3154555 RepID=UPI0033A5312B
MPIVATTLELLAEHGPLGPVWWRYGRPGRHCPTEALENPDNRAAYDRRQAAREDEWHKAHQELMDSLACVDCGDVPEQESSWVYGSRKWTRCPGGRCWTCHQDRKERLEREAEEQLEAARAANASLRPCWTCRGSIGGQEGSELELRQEADPYRLECPHCAFKRRNTGRPPIILPLPTNRDRRRAAAGKLDDPYWHIRLHHAADQPAQQDPDR